MNYDRFGARARGYGRVLKIAALGVWVASCSGDSMTSGTVTDGGSSTAASSDTSTTASSASSTTVGGSGGSGSGGSTTAGPTTDTGAATETATSATTDALTTTGVVVTTSDATTDDPTGTSTGGVCPQEFEVPQCVPAQGPPNAVACQLDVECGPQQQCFVIPLLGGLCGECTQDADCQGGGCTPPNPLQSTGAICNNGQLCAGCESDATCVDPAAALCGTVIDAAGIITVDTCGQCKTSADCSDEAPNCVPVVDSINDFTGYRACVPDCSRPQDATCEPDEHASCAPGFCTIAVLMGVIELGLCGECLSDADCEPGQSCSDPEVDINNDTMTGARCI